MKHVLGIGRVFFDAQYSEKLAARYREQLSLDVEDSLLEGRGLGGEGFEPPTYWV